MGKKVKFPFLSKINTDSKSSWPWPAYCQQPRTLSFRIGDNAFKTINSAFLDAAANNDVTPESWFTNSSESASFSTASDESGGDSLETVIRGLRSERLFFEPGETSSILEEAKAGDGFPFKESVVLSIESQNPIVDFKRSMEEMVEAHGLKDWEGLEDLLCCYLKVNGKGNHGYIIGAFVDLLVGSSIHQVSCSCSRSPSSPLSFYTSSASSCSFDDSSSSTPCVSSVEARKEIGINPCLSSSEADENYSQN